MWEISFPLICLNLSIKGKLMLSCRAGMQKKGGKHALLMTPTFQAVLAGKS